jgi:sirohydrochlorin cobaltochelatase
VEEFAARWRLRHPNFRVELCFIELAEVLLPEGLDRAALGSSRVIVLPLILNAAGHVKVEIPEALAAARERHPHTELVYAPHLGTGTSLLRVLRRNLQQTLNAMDMPDPKTTGVVLLARGSSDPAANGGMAALARRLFEEGEHELVDLAFTGVAHPRLESVVQRQARLGMTQIAVLPYYLFSGTLIERIKRQVERLRGQYPRLCIEHSGYFGFEEEVFALLDERLAEAGTGEDRLACDGCPFRAEVAAHSHVHRAPQQGVSP